MNKYKSKKKPKMVNKTLWRRAIKTATIIIDHKHHEDEELYDFCCSLGFNPFD